MSRPSAGTVRGEICSMFKATFLFLFAISKFYSILTFKYTTAKRKNKQKAIKKMKVILKGRVLKITKILFFPFHLMSQYLLIQNP